MGDGILLHAHMIPDTNFKIKIVKQILLVSLIQLALLHVLLDLKRERGATMFANDKVEALSALKAVVTCSTVALSFTMVSYLDEWYGIWISR